MVKQTIQERRQASRAKRILSIQYRLVKAKGRSRKIETEWYLSTTHDMSVAGLTFLSDRNYHVDDTLELHVVMSGVLDIFKGHGKIVRIEKKKTGAFYLIAVKFVKIHNIKRRSVKTYTTNRKANRVRKVSKSR